MIDLKRERILLTGGAGFVGSHVAEELTRRGVPPASITIPRSARCDLRDPDIAARTVKGHTVVIHLAATVGGIGFNMANGPALLRDNLLMGIYLLDAAVAERVRKFVQIGTVCAYPKFTPVPFREEDLWKGYPEETNAPYGLAKKMLLVQGDALARTKGLPFVYLIPTNLYGPRDCFTWERSHVIPALIRKCVEAVREGRKEVEVWGDGSPTREFLYVEDCACAIVEATERYDKPDPVNLGTGEEVSIKELTETIARLCGFTGALRWNPAQPNGQPRRKVDTSRAEREFGFHARVPMREGLAKTIDWYRANPA